MKILPIVLLALLLPMFSSAYDAQIDGVYYNLKWEEKIAEVTYSSSGETSYSGDVTIPDEITYGSTTFAVTGIGARAFKNCNSMTAIHLPSGISYIGESAFWKCNKLTSVSIPGGVATIGEYAFQNCI